MHCIDEMGTCPQHGTPSTFRLVVDIELSPPIAATWFCKDPPWATHVWMFPVIGETDAV